LGLNLSVSVEMRRNFCLSFEANIRLSLFARLSREIFHLNIPLGRNAFSRPRGI